MYLFDQTASIAKLSEHHKWRPLESVHLHLTSNSGRKPCALDVLWHKIEGNMYYGGCEIVHCEFTHHRVTCQSNPETSSGLFPSCVSLEWARDLDLDQDLICVHFMLSVHQNFIQVVCLVRFH